MDRKEEHDRTIRYYDHNAQQYFRDTVHVDMSACHDMFLRYVIPGGTIVDVGAGSGRDLKYFRDKGYRVEGIDASGKLCRLASAYAGAEVRCVRIQEWEPQRMYDGIWANASLLHLTMEEIGVFLLRVHDHLKAEGVIYFSVKKGVLAGYDSHGRYFTGFSEGDFQQFVDECGKYEILESRILEDGMGRRGLQWLSFILGKKAV